MADDNNGVAGLAIGIVIAIGSVVVGAEEFVRGKIRKGAERKRQKQVTEGWNASLTPVMLPPESFIQTVEKNNALSQLVSIPLSKEEQEDWKPFILSSLGQLGYGAAAAASFNGLLQCDIPVSQLFAAKGATGQLRGFSMVDGKISQQGKFQQVSLGHVAPLLIYQALSVVTSQYYQNIIAKRLNDLTQKVDRLALYLQAEDKAQLKNAYDKLKEFSQQSSFSDLDWKALEEISDRMNVIRYKCQDLLSNVNLGIEHEGTDFAEAESKIAQLNSSCFFIYLDIARCAEVLYFSANVLLVKAATASGAPEDIISKYQNRLSLDFWSSYAEKFGKVKNDVIGYVSLAEKSAWFNKKKIEALLPEVEGQFNTQFCEFKKVSESLDKPLRVYLAINEKGEVVQYKAIDPDDAVTV